MVTEGGRSHSGYEADFITTANYITRQSICMAYKPEPKFTFFTQLPTTIYYHSINKHTLT
jgi:hypothetical protein